MTKRRLKLALTKRRLKLALAVVLAAIVAFLLLRFLGCDDPLPGLGNKLPTYATSIYGPKAPMGVAVSPDGERVYVTETGGRRLVRVYDRHGRQVDRLRPPGHEGSWRLPVYVAVSPRNGDVFVSDRLLQTVFVYRADGRFRRAFRPTGRLGKGAKPLGLGFDARGRLYMTDVAGGRASHRVLLFGRGTEPLRRIGARDSFWFPNGVAIDARDNLYVSDSNNGRVAIFDPGGDLVSSIQRGVGQGDLGLPRGVAIDGEQRLYVVDTTSHTVKLYEIEDEEAGVPVYVGSFGVQGIADGAFQYPNGIAIDADGRIYVTDRENNRVQVWTH